MHDMLKQIFEPHVILLPRLGNQLEDHSVRAACHHIAQIIARLQKDAQGSTPNVKMTDSSEAQRIFL